MKPLYTATLVSFVALSACDSTNPFMEDEEPVETTTETDTEEEETDVGFVTGGGGVPPGVDGPNGTPNEEIVRYEERNANGGGYAEEFAYDAATDTFTVDNLAFDGEDAYTRGVAVASLGPNDSYAVYDAQVSVPDFLTANAVGQIVPYRAIVGISPNTVERATDDPAVTETLPRSSFAIVRTGGYRDYGFGGFVYQRQGNVVMQDTGQAIFSGDYAGVRIFTGPDGTLGGLEFTEADMEISIDFDDPTDGQGGIRGSIFNRVAYDINGVPVTLGNDGEAGELPLPGISFVLNGETGNLNADGELTGGLISSYTDPDGNTEVYETGTYYGILAGDTTDAADGGELVGVLVIESSDPRFDGVTAQETGGFILLR